MLSARSIGKTARFATVIEPYEYEPLIVSATVHSAGEIRVELAGGRVQTIKVENMDGGGADIAVEVTETDADGNVLRLERSGC